MTKWTHQLRRTICFGAAAGALVAGAAEAQVAAAQVAAAAEEPKAAFGKLVESVQRDPASASAETMVELMNLGNRVGQPQAAAAVVKTYLAVRRDVTPAILLQAAETAEWAGDLRSAVVRYKQFLKQVPPGADTSATTLRLYFLLVDAMGATDDAYRLMTEMGTAARASLPLKRYDRWYLAEARRRSDVPAAARRLAAVMADQQPLEMERLAYWDHLNWLTETLSAARPEYFPALPDCRRIAGMIRENDVWSKRFGFMTANLAFYAGAGGKDAATLDREFEAVVAAAKAYVDAAPKAETVRDIYWAFSGGLYHWDGNIFAAQRQVKASVFPYAFGKLNDKQREEILGQGPNWNPDHWTAQLTTRERYGELLAAYPDFFRKSPAAERIPLVSSSTNPAVYKALAPFAQGVPSYDALVITALGSHDDLAACWQRVIQDSWHLPSFDHIRGANDAIWNLYSRFPRDEARKLPDNAYDRALFRFGTDVLAKTPVFLFDIEMARRYLSSAWSFSGTDSADKTRFAEALRLLDWIPYADRQAVFGGVNGQFRTWAEQSRNQQRDCKAQADAAAKAVDTARKQREDEAKKPNATLQGLDAQLADRTKTLDARKADLAKADAAAALITTLEAEFNKTLDPKAVDPAKAPNDLCRHLARAVIAVNEKNLAAYQEAARAAYAMVRQYPAQKTPFGRATLQFLLQNRLDAFDTIDFQCEVLADQIALGAPESGNRVVTDAWSQIGEGRNSWAKANLLKLNAALASSLRGLFARNQHSPKVFSWFLSVRSQAQAMDSDLDILETLITRKELLADNPDRVVNLMYWVRGYFPKLAEKYPPETWFDAAFVENARQRRYVDRRYFEYGGRDEKGLIIQATAEIFQGYDRLPFGYDGGTVVYDSRDWFWDLQYRALSAPPAARDAMLARIESCFGKTRFDQYANGAMRLVTLSVGGPADRKRFFDSLDTWVAAREQEPIRAATQPPLSPLAALRGSELTDSELNVLIRLVQLWPAWNPSWSGDLDRLVNEGLRAKQRSRELLALAPRLWGMVRSDNGWRDRLTDSVNAMAAAGLTDLAASYAAAGIEIIGAGFKEDQRDAMMALRSKALSGVLSVVAVDRADRRFPIFKAQADYHMGKFEEAWQGYAANRALFTQACRELDPSFSIWLIGKLTDTGDFTEAEAAARLMIQWVDQVPQSFDPEDRASLLLAYAQIAFVRQEYPRAYAICEQVASAKEFEETTARTDAELKIAEIERLTKHYDKAIERLERMLRRPAAYVQTEANYGIALVKFDQEEYPESRAFVDKVLAISPAHPSARILEGKLYLKLKKLIEATDVQVGLSASQQTLLPGKPLKISLEDPSLGTVGKSVNIEIKAWTDSGDEELFLLLPFGDSKTKFEGSLPTALAETRKADKTLQVRGGDLVHYDFSDAFKRANKIAGREPVSIRVISDGELLISSGRIVSKEDQERRRLENMIRARLDMTEDAAENVVALSTVRADDEIKPGNRINVRVIDPGESVTTNRDTVSVKVTTSSGDRIARVPLAETGPYTGVFEGYIQTTSAQATAFAFDSAEGKDPNFAITGAEYPPWVALPDNRRPKSFSVDLNNNCALGVMKIAADVPGRKLKKFIVQTSENGKDFATLGAWPENLKAWTGAAWMEVVRFADATRPPATLREFQEYLAVGYACAGYEKVSVAPPPLDVTWDSSVNGLGDRLKVAWDGAGSWYLGHMQLAFYQEARQKRTFRLAPLDPRATSNRELIITLNGAEGRHPREVTQSLGRGMHRLDIYFAANRQAGLRFRLETEEPGPTPQFVKCAPGMFTTPANVEAGELKAIAFQPAAITNSADNGLFTVTFPSDALARMIRLWLVDFETDAPAIRKITLADSAGKTILPTAQDVLKLRDNDLLEIVPGDRVTVTYEDPNFLTKERRFSEAFMNVTYNNATLSACLMESATDNQGNRYARYIPIRRFKPGDAVNVFVRDPDCDTTDQADGVKLRAAVGGLSILVDALETEVHSGIFLAKIFPVTNAPQRASEIQIRPGDDLALSYLDAENTNPGIPWNRTCEIEQISYSIPEVRAYGYTSRPLTDSEAAEVRVPKADSKQAKLADEYVPPRRSIAVTRPVVVTNAGASVLLGCPLVVEIVHPGMALSPASRAAIFVQTESGRKAYGKPPEGDFDIQVPGTVKFEVPPNDRLAIEPPPGYLGVSVPRLETKATALDDGRFTFTIPVRLGATPTRSLVDVKPEGLAASGADSDWEKVGIEVPAFDELGKTRAIYQTLLAPVLRVRGNDTLYVGYSYRDKEGSNRWMTASATLASDPFLDVMDRRYREAVTNLHVGETIYLRVIHPGLDLSDEKDSATVQVRTSSGQTAALTLSETLGHSGVFKGLSQVVYTGDPAASNAAATAVRINYGDIIDLAYAPAGATQAVNWKVAVFRGDDGSVMPFTKRFKDPSIAVQTQLTVAEAYFEMAKKHRDIGQEDLARREIGQGKKLLEEAIRDFPHTDVRAQADYLLADLALEFATQVENPEQKTKYYVEAVGRFTEIVASYPDSPYAPKGQFKKALTYEKMGRIDEACEEYVKLSYRYPDNELVAETIARLGQYFLTKGKGYEDKMKMQSDAVERERTRMESLEMYKTAAQVFGRLSTRFPDHRLAGKTLVLSGQCYMRAQEYARSIGVFKDVIEAKKAEPDLIAEAMYWCGDCYMKSISKPDSDMKGDPVSEAYRMFKKLTWDYPETVWAKYARGRLTEEKLAAADGEASK